MSREDWLENQHERAQALLQAKIERLREERDQLREKVSALYTAAFWHADRPCDAAKLWTEVRDAARIPVGTGSAIQ